MLMRGILVTFARAGVESALVLCALLGSGSFASVASAESCPNATFRSGPSANLPDCRAYEQVTPFEPDGGRMSVPTMGVGPDGTSVLALESFAALAGVENDDGVSGADYSLHRSATGWDTTPVIPSASQYVLAWPAGYIGPSLAGYASLDNSTFPWIARANAWPESRYDLILRRTDGTIADVGPLTTPEAPAQPEPFNQVGEQGAEIRGVSDDLSQILFTLTPNEAAGYHYWPFDNTAPVEEGHRAAESLYEYVGTNNTAPMLVGVDNKDKLISTCGTSLGGESSSSSGGERQGHNAVSADGSTVYFTARSAETASTCSGPLVDELFARIDNGLADAHTVAISEPSGADCPACDTSEGVLQPGHFEGASQDGSTVFFTTTQPLLGGDTSRNIYEYDFEPPAGQPKVVRVSGGDSTVTDPVADVEGVVRSSEDGSHVYFVAQGVLTRTANGRGQVAQTGANNLYVFERDSQYPAGRTEFIADLPETDARLWAREEFPHEADATPDGRFLVFVSSGDLTPDDTSSQRQVFEYDAQSGELKRISIGENGYNDNGNNDALEAGTANIISPNFEGASKPLSYWSGMTMSADGAYVFFRSSLALTPQASNDEESRKSVEGAIPVFNIYEYHDGSVYLISDPKDSGAYEELLGTDASGADVFFESTDELVPQDTIVKKNVFDARIDGGLPAPVTPPACSGDGCQGPLSPAPVLLSPGSEFQAGGGNFASPASVPAVKAKTKAKKKSKTRAKRKSKVKKTKGRTAKSRRRGRSDRKAGRS